MIDTWLQALSEVLSQNLWIGLLISLAAGLLTSFTPCSLSSVPLIIGYVGGYTDNKKRAFFYSLMFCIGMAILFTALGVVAALVGRLFLGIQMYWYIILGVLMFVMALQTWGVINIFRRVRYGNGRGDICIALFNARSYSYYSGCFYGAINSNGYFNAFAVFSRS